jgi:hypothetical protein
MFVAKLPIGGESARVRAHLHDQWTWHFADGDSVVRGSRALARRAGRLMLLLTHWGVITSPVSRFSSVPVMKTTQARDGDHPDSLPTGAAPSLFDSACRCPGHGESGPHGASQQRSTHIVQTREVWYSWHPWCGRAVKVHATLVKRGVVVAHCSSDMFIAIGF